MNASLLKSERQDWRTPDVVLDLVRKIDRIGLDPCTTPDNPVGAEAFFTEADNGLSRGFWGVYGLTYANPPYGRALTAWAMHFAHQGAAGAELITLTPARTDTRWWQSYMVQATAICFWRGRLTFKGAPAPAPFPSAVCYWGPRVYEFSKIFGRYGWWVKP